MDVQGCMMGLWLIDHSTELIAVGIRALLDQRKSKRSNLGFSGSRRKRP